MFATYGGRVRIPEWNQQRAHQHAFGDRSNACRLLTHVRKSRYLTCPQIAVYKIDRRFTCKHVRYNAVPMRITHSGALEVEGRIGRNRYSFVVDTGGFATLVPTQIAKQNGIPVIGTTVNAKGIHSKERPVGVTIAPEFDLGNCSLGPVLIGVTGLPEGPEDLRHQFGGLIGADFFFERGGIIDIGSKTLYFK